ncbi:MAG: hypothetical protein PHO32_06575 [Candidatus Cloacimonetes bacterium]|nr:hypothetical protein [Candidatus Cloacimonadota bacterium]
MDIYETKQVEYQVVMGTNPLYFTEVNNCSVEQLSRYNAIENCNGAGLNRLIDN